MYDVLILGGGVTGLAIARQLCRYELSVACLEKEADIATGATKANSAIVHGGYAEKHTTHKGRLCYQGRRQFARLQAELHFGFLPIGSLVLAFEDEQRAGLVSLLENGRKNGLPDLELVDAAQLRRLEPNVSPDAKYGLYCKGAGIMSPFGLAIALAENAVKNGLELFLNSEVVKITHDKTAPKAGFAVTTAAGAVHTGRYLVNAAGLFAADMAALAGARDFSITPRSGEYVLLSKGTGALVNHVLFQMPTRMGKGILVTPTVYGNLLLGPDALDETRAERDTHAERLYAIYQKAKKTAPDIDITKYLRSFAGVRAVADTDDFFIGPGSVPGLIHAAGIQSPGLTSSPAVAERVRDALADAGLELRGKPDFNPYRVAPSQCKEPLSGAQLKPLLELPEGDAQRIVCRCQQVSEGEIDEALGRGLPVTTVDGVKRRTGAGMGWCQGQYCRPRVVSLLSHFLAQPADGRTDVQRDGLQRVEREEMLAYVAAQVQK